ncbi:hypothetical protein CV102_18135 [Natronococcus pandeyae]|uniref:DDE Tnp4 domain-containing protein n=1 Tax=Natronococcus pandeyae TaxID=2055836 RepID=A0A8J8Q1N5_9EURY|nr:hypothetical protein CV102_18135 [Natronococcus pandeyae]
MVGDSGFHMLEQAVVPIAPYNLRNPHDIDYCVEERIKEHSNTVRLWQTRVKETYSHRSQVETAIGVCKMSPLGPRGSEAK